MNKYPDYCKIKICPGVRWKRLQTRINKYGNIIFPETMTETASHIKFNSIARFTIPVFARFGHARTNKPEVQNGIMVWPLV